MLLDPAAVVALGKNVLVVVLILGGTTEGSAKEACMQIFAGVHNMCRNLRLASAVLPTLLPPEPTQWLQGHQINCW